MDVKALLAKSAARLGSATSGAGGTGTAAYGVAEKHESGGGRIALFEEIRRGKVLRKVPEDKQRRGGPAPSRGGARRAAEQEVDRRQGRIARDGGSRWVVEGWEGQEEVAVQGVAMGEGVQVMGCKKSMVAVEGKVNAVVIEHCEGLGLLMGSAVSVVEAIRCERLRLQVKGTAPLIEVDSSTDVTLYLSPECAEMVQVCELEDRAQQC